MGVARWRTRTYVRSWIGQSVAIAKRVKHSLIEMSEAVSFHAFLKWFCANDLLCFLIQNERMDTTTRELEAELEKILLGSPQVPEGVPPPSNSPPQAHRRASPPRASPPRASPPRASPPQAPPQAPPQVPPQAPPRGTGVAQSKYDTHTLNCTAQTRAHTHVHKCTHT